MAYVSVPKDLTKVSSGKQQCCHNYGPADAAGLSFRYVRKGRHASGRGADPYDPCQMAASGSQEI